MACVAITLRHLAITTLLYRKREVQIVKILSERVLRMPIKIIARLSIVLLEGFMTSMNLMASWYIYNIQNFRLDLKFVYILYEILRITCMRQIAFNDRNIENGHFIYSYTLT